MCIYAKLNLLFHVFLLTCSHCTINFKGGREGVLEKKVFIYKI